MTHSIDVETISESERVPVPQKSRALLARTHRSDVRARALCPVCCTLSRALLARTHRPQCSLVRGLQVRASRVDSNLQLKTCIASQTSTATSTPQSERQHAARFLRSSWPGWRRSSHSSWTTRCASYGRHHHPGQHDPRIFRKTRWKRSHLHAPTTECVNFRV